MNIRTPSLSFLCLSVLLITAALPTVAAAESITVQATLIKASNESGPTDDALRRYEANLRRLFRFNRYQRIGSDRVSIRKGATGSLQPGAGYTIELGVLSADPRGTRIRVRWVTGSGQNRKTLMETAVRTRPNRPTVLGGPRYEGGNLIVILETR